MRLRLVDSLHWDRQRRIDIRTESDEDWRTMPETCVIHFPPRSTRSCCGWQCVAGDENEEETRHECICHDGGKLKRHRSAAFRNEECSGRLRFHLCGKTHRMRAISPSFPIPFPSFFSLSLSFSLPRFWNIFIIHGSITGTHQTGTMASSAWHAQ